MHVSNRIRVFVRVEKQPKILTRIFRKSALSFGGSGSLEGIAGNRIPENCFYTKYDGHPSTDNVDRKRFL